MKTLALLSLSTLPLIAALSDRVEKLEQEMQQVGATTSMDTYGAQFAEGTFEGKGNGITLTLEPLYWHAKVGATEYAYTVKNARGLNNTQNQIEGSLKENSFDSDWGIKVGVGCTKKYDHWDLYLNYTYYETSDSDSTTKALPAGIQESRAFAGFSVIAHRAKSHFDIDYNNLDLELGKRFYVSTHIALRPHVGLKSAWIDLDQKITYTLTQELGIPAIWGHDQKVKDSSDFWGLGPRIGLDSNWNLGYGFSILGNTSLALLWGHEKATHKQSYPEHLTILGINDFDIKMKGKFHHFSPFFNALLGLQWDTFFNADKMHLSLSGAYEVQYYWRQNQMILTEEFSAGANIPPHFRLQFNKASEDVMFYGLNFKARLDF